MNPNRLLGCSLLSLALLLPAGCALFGGSPTGLQRVDVLLSRTERLHVAVENAKQRAEEAVVALHTLVTGEYSDAPAAVHQRLTLAIKASHQQADELESSLEAVRGAGEPCFEQWSQDLMTIQNLELRQRSQTRLTATRTRYQAILDAAGPALAAHRQLNQGLQDQAVFLGFDFNSDSVAAVTNDVAALRQQATDLGTSFDACLSASLAYVQAAAPPTPAALPAR